MKAYGFLPFHYISFSIAALRSRRTYVRLRLEIDDFCSKSVRSGAHFVRGSWEHLLAHGITEKKKEVLCAA